VQNPPGEISALLTQIKSGNRDAEAKLVPLIYAELRRLAASYMRRERPDHTLQPTALVHEAYVRLVQQDDFNWNNRSEFLGIAARIMRQILVDHARAHNAGKRTGKLHKVDLEHALVYAEEQSSDIIALDHALARLNEWDPRQSRIVELRFFGGLSVEDTAQVLGISTRTVKRDWNVARVWLHGELSRQL